MCSRRVFQLAVATLSVGLLSSCGYVHVGRLPAPIPATIVGGDEHLTKENSDLRLEKKLLQQELALTRAQGEALRRAIENRSADGDTSKRLAERLTETSRELAALRSEYTQLQRDRDQAIASATESNALRTRLGATEDKLAVSLRTTTELQEEIGRLRGEVTRTRTENLALGEQVKSLTHQNAAALAALAQLNTDLLTQKDARIRAEQDAETLRSHLHSVSPNASILAQQRTGAAGEARSLAAEHAAEIAALKQQLDASRTQLDRLETERTQLKQHLASRQTTDADANQSNTVLRDENEQLKATSAQLLAAKAELETQLARLKHGSAAQQVQVLREQLQASHTQANAISEENARLKTRVASTRSVPTTLPRVPMALGGSPDGNEPEAPQPVAITTETAPVVENSSSVTATLVTRAPGSLPNPPSRIELPGRGRVHVVAGGDTLSRISARYYGTPGRWGDILAANRDVLGETNNLVIGRALRIP